jgi:hypothetical protein
MADIARRGAAASQTVTPPDSALAGTTGQGGTAPSSPLACRAGPAPWSADRLAACRDVVSSAPLETCRLASRPAPCKSPWRRVPPDVLGCTAPSLPRQASFIAAARGSRAWIRRSSICFGIMPQTHGRGVSTPRRSTRSGCRSDAVLAWRGGRHPARSTPRPTGPVVRLTPEARRGVARTRRGQRCRRRRSLRRPGCQPRPPLGWSRSPACRGPPSGHRRPASLAAGSHAGSEQL